MQRFRHKSPWCAAAVLCALLCLHDSATNGAAAGAIFRSDFDFYWQTVAADFAYFNAGRPRARWDTVRKLYRPRAEAVTDRAGLIRLLEDANNELFNGHVALNTNLPTSNRIVPSGADVWVEPVDGRFVVASVRAGFNADRSGMRPGMVVERFDGVPLATAMRRFLPRATPDYTRPMLEYAANMVLAGRHDRRRVIEVRSGGGTITFRPDSTPNRVERAERSLLQTARLSGGFGYIKLNNSLGEVATVADFDRALDALAGTRGLVVDLTDTPSGGTSTVARGILGRFVSRERPYQKIVYPDEQRLYGIRRAEFDLVSPREPLYRKPVAVLVGRWTGSMGEGLAIGFADAANARLIGTKMAGLLGAVCSYETPATHVPFSIPCQQTDEIGGSPREDFAPPLGSGRPSDLELAKRRLIDST